LPVLKNAVARAKRLRAAFHPWIISGCAQEFKRRPLRQRFEKLKNSGNFVFKLL
jgi:hypothetical protein